MCPTNEKRLYAVAIAWLFLLRNLATCKADLNFTPNNGEFNHSEGVETTNTNKQGQAEGQYLSLKKYVEQKGLLGHQPSSSHKLLSNQFNNDSGTTTQPLKNAQGDSNQSLDELKAAVEKLHDSPQDSLKSNYQSSPTNNGSNDWADKVMGSLIAKMNELHTINSLSSSINDTNSLDSSESSKESPDNLVNSVKNFFDENILGKRHTMPRDKDTNSIAQKSLLEISQSILDDIKSDGWIDGSYTNRMISQSAGRKGASSGMSGSSGSSNFQQDSARSQKLQSSSNDNNSVLSPIEQISSDWRSNRNAVWPKQTSLQDQAIKDKIEPNYSKETISSVIPLLSRDEQLTTKQPLSEQATKENKKPASNEATLKSFTGHLSVLLLDRDLDDASQLDLDHLKRQEKQASKSLAMTKKGMSFMHFG